MIALPICQHRGVEVEPGACQCFTNRIRHRRRVNGVGIVTHEFCADKCWCPDKPLLDLPQRMKRRDVPVPQLDLTCPHRSPEPIREGKCDQCGYEKGQPFAIFGCDLHGECSLHKRHSAVKGCAACEDRPRPVESFSVIQSPGSVVLPAQATDGPSHENGQRNPDRQAGPEV